MPVFTGGANSADPGEVMGGTYTYGPGTGRQDDDLFDEAARQSSSGLAINVTVRRATGVSAGTPEAGVAKRPTFLDTIVQVYLYDITPEDVAKAGGFYELGDIILGFEEFAIRSIGHELRSGQSETDTEGDRIVFNIDAEAPLVPLEYRIVGNVDFHPFGPLQIVRKVHCRKLALPTSTS